MKHGDIDYINDYLCYWGYYSDSACSTHYNLVVLIRKRTIGVYVVVVVVIFNAPSWLSGVLCYHSYKPARAWQAPLLGGALKAGLQQQRG